MATVPYPNLSLDEAGADALYDFPSGTMEALGATESGNGSNLGTIGNVFQILPSTAANPGYGLPSLNGNSAYDAGSYLSALQNGPAGGSLSTALSMYHGGPANPTPYGASTPVATFLNGLSVGGEQPLPEPGDVSTPTAATTPSSSVGSTFSAWLKFLAGGAPSGQTTTGGELAGIQDSSSGIWGWVLRGAIFLIAIILFTAGLFALLKKSDTVKAIVRTASTVAE